MLGSDAASSAAQNPGLDESVEPVSPEEEEEVSFSRDCDNLSLYSPLLEFLLTSQYFRHYARPHKSLISDW